MLAASSHMRSRHVWHSQQVQGSRSIPHLAKCTYTRVWGRGLSMPVLTYRNLRSRREGTAVSGGRLAPGHVEPQAACHSQHGSCVRLYQLTEHFRQADQGDPVLQAA